MSGSECSRQQATGRDWPCVTLIARYYTVVGEWWRSMPRALHIQFTEIHSTRVSGCGVVRTSRQHHPRGDLCRRYKPYSTHIRCRMWATRAIRRPNIHNNNFSSHTFANFLVIVICSHNNNKLIFNRHNLKEIVYQ